MFHRQSALVDAMLHRAIIANGVKMQSAFAKKRAAGKYPKRAALQARLNNLRRDAAK